jgi:hypothetical protein
MWPLLIREMAAPTRSSGRNGSRGVAIAYLLDAMERATKVRDVILQALAGKLTSVLQRYGLPMALYTHLPIGAPRSYPRRGHWAQFPASA